MTTAPVSLEDLRKQTEQMLARFQMSMDDFLGAELDDLSDAELRDLWLMVRDLLVAA